MVACLSMGEMGRPCRLLALALPLMPPPLPRLCLPFCALPADKIKALSKQFGKWHGISSLINLTTLIVGEWLGGWVAGCCPMACMLPPASCPLAAWHAPDTPLASGNIAPPAAIGHGWWLASHLVGILA